MRNEQINGIVNILKPSGMTSHDAVHKIRKIFGIQKVGHTGTLDQNVSGVLPIVLGKGTKLSQILTDKDKTYRCMMTFGKRTDTSDTFGTVIDEDERDIDLEKVRAVCEKFTGKMEQTPSMYSAIKVRGEKLYNIARRGGKIDDIPKRIINIKTLDILRCDDKTLVFDIECSKGTYIRSVVEDIAQKLGTIAYMNMLIRTKSGQFDIKDSVIIEDVTSKDIIPMEDIALNGEKEIILDENQLIRYKNGLLVTRQYIRNFENSESNIYKIYDEDKTLISIGTFEGERLKNMVML